MHYSTLGLEIGCVTGFVDRGFAVISLADVALGALYCVCSCKLETPRPTFAMVGRILGALCITQHLGLD